MNAAQKITVAAKSTTDGAMVVTYRWSQYQVTANWTNQESAVSPIGAMTRDEAAAYARNARTVCGTVAGFVDMKLSLVNCEYVERETFERDLSEDGDGSPVRHQRAVSGTKWTRSVTGDRNFAREASDAVDSCKAMQDYYRATGF